LQFIAIRSQAASYLHYPVFIIVSIRFAHVHPSVTNMYLWSNFLELKNQRIFIKRWL